MQFAAKKISRFTAKPECQDWRAANRLAKYLKDSRRVVTEYKFQKLPEKGAIWLDTDFAGHKSERRSTSGGVQMFGSHCVKTCSQTQEIVAWSSGEPEFYGIVEAATMA